MYIPFTVVFMLCASWTFAATIQKPPGPSLSSGSSSQQLPPSSIIEASLNQFRKRESEPSTAAAAAELLGIQLSELDSDGPTAKRQVAAAVKRWKIKYHPDPVPDPVQKKKFNDLCANGDKYGQLIVDMIEARPQSRNSQSSEQRSSPVEDPQRASTPRPPRREKHRPYPAYNNEDRQNRGRNSQNSRYSGSGDPFTWNDDPRRHGQAESSRTSSRRQSSSSFRASDQPYFAPRRDQFSSRQGRPGYQYTKGRNPEHQSTGGQTPGYKHTGRRAPEYQHARGRSPYSQYTERRAPSYEYTGGRNPHHQYARGRSQEPSTRTRYHRENHGHRAMRASSPESRSPYGTPFGQNTEFERYPPNSGPRSQRSQSYQNIHAPGPAQQRNFRGAKFEQSPEQPGSSNTLREQNQNVKSSLFPRPGTHGGSGFFPRPGTHDGSGFFPRPGTYNRIGSPPPPASPESASNIEWETIKPSWAND